MSIEKERIQICISSVVKAATLLLLHVFPSAFNDKPTGQTHSWPPEVFTTQKWLQPPLFDAQELETLKQKRENQHSSSSSVQHIFVDLKVTKQPVEPVKPPLKKERQRKVILMRFHCILFMR